MHLISDLRLVPLLAACASFAGSVACNDDATKTTDTSASDTAVVDSTQAETTVADTSADSAVDTTVDDTTDTAEEVTPGPYGFGIRHPRPHVEPPCDIHSRFETGPFAAADIDYICTFAYQGATHTLYFQSSPSGCYNGGMSPLPTFTTVGWVSKAGVVSALDAEHYDYGGNHHNDAIAFALDGTSFTYGHSSFGTGFRACAPPDCLQRMDATSPSTVADDGCTPARTHPIVCRLIKDDATFDALDDTFAKCPGDPNP